VASTTKLFEEGVVDSLGLLLIVEYLEDEFDVTIDDDELQIDNFASIETLTRFIEKKSVG
jgi:acyl carrier protein